MSLRRTNLYLDEAQTRALDQLAVEQGISRAELVRRLVDHGIGTTAGDLDADLDAIDRSFGVLAEIPPPDRHPGEREAHLERLRRP